MNGFEVYQTYLAIKSHFDRESYNALKYNFKVRVNPSSFDKRRDRYQFEKLSRKFKDKQELINYFVSNFVYDDSIKWIGNMKDDNLLQYNKIHQAISEYFKTDLSKLNIHCQKASISFDMMLSKSSDGSIYPDIIGLFHDGTIHIESVCILHQLTNFLTHINKIIEDTILWPDLYHKLYKYNLFVHCNKDKMRKLVVSEFQ